MRRTSSESGEQSARIAPLPLTASILVFIAAIVLRWQSAADPLWIDELHTAWVVRGSLFEVPQRAWAGNQLPSWYFLVWPLCRLGVSPEIGLRILSLAASTGTVIALSWIVFRWTRCTMASLLVMTLAAIDDKFLFFGSEARPYALVQLLGICQIALFAELLTSPENRRRRNWWCGLSVALAWLQPVTLVLLGAEFLVWSGMRLRFKDLKWQSFHDIWRWSIPFGVLLAIPIGASMALAGDAERFLRFVDPAAFSRQWGADAFLLLGIPATAAWFCGVFRKSENNRLAVVLAVHGVAVAGALLLTIAARIPLAEYRYLIAPMTGMFLATGWMIGKLRRAWSAVTAALVMVLATASNPLLPGFLQLGKLPAQRNEPWGRIAELLNRDSRPICFYPNLVEDGMLERAEPRETQTPPRDDYFLFPLTGRFPIEGVESVARRVEALSLLSQQVPSLPMRRTIEASGGCWILIRGWPSDANAVVAQVLTAVGGPARCEVHRLNAAPLNLFRLEFLPSPPY